jgi:hypothetical protein
MRPYLKMKNRKKKKDWGLGQYKLSKIKCEEKNTKKL